MRRTSFRSCLERLSFIFWIILKSISISLLGLGFDGLIYVAFFPVFISSMPIHFSLSLIFAGGTGLFFSVVWWQLGVDYLHYSVHDTLTFAEVGDHEHADMLRLLIQEVESQEGFARNEARAKAKSWLITNVASLHEEDVLLAKERFGYMLPAGWGEAEEDQRQREPHGLL
jgi:hypothetical protein